MNNSVYYIQKFGRFLKRIIRWLPLLWRQEDWDFEYIYDLLEFKLKEIQKCLAKDDLHVDSPKMVKQISICLAHLDRYRNWDKYIDFPSEIKLEKTADGLITLCTSTEEKIACKKITNFEKYHFDMFWKRFVQWHKGWWC